MSFIKSYYFLERIEGFCGRGFKQVYLEEYILFKFLGLKVFRRDVKPKDKLISLKVLDDKETKSFMNVINLSTNLSGMELKYHRDLYLMFKGFKMAKLVVSCDKK